MEGMVRWKADKMSCSIVETVVEFCSSVGELKSFRNWEEWNELMISYHPSRCVFRERDGFVISIEYVVIRGRGKNGPLLEDEKIWQKGTYGRSHLRIEYFSPLISIKTTRRLKSGKKDEVMKNTGLCEVKTYTENEMFCYLLESLNNKTNHVRTCLIRRKIGKYRKLNGGGRVIRRGIKSTNETAGSARIRWTTLKKNGGK